MRLRHFTRIICILFILSLLASDVPAAFASDEPAEEFLSEAETEAIAEYGEDPVEAPGEEPVEVPAEELIELPVSEGEEIDPILLRMGMQLDGGTDTFSMFTPRALNNETLHRGIDVSVWQYSINWKKVAASGVDFAIIRAAGRYSGSGGLYDDSLFTANINGAKAAGLKVGVYFFSQAITVAEAIEEADYLIAKVKGYDIDLPLVFDFEYLPGGRLSEALGKRLSTDICLAFCARVEAAGYDSMVYANPYTLLYCLYPQELGRLWLAHYTATTSYSASEYEYWQCSGSGTVDGINTDVDLDFWFEPNEKTPNFPFADVTTGDWFYANVKKAYEAGIVSGATKTTFEPYARATRGQVVTMIHRMKGEPAWTKTASFTDLTYDYYKNAIFWAAENGIVNGYSAERFGPDKAISREELVTILYNMEGKPAVRGDLAAFADGGSVQSYAKNAMIWAVQNGIITGYAEDGTLRPQNSANRAEVCAILMRYRAL